MDPNPYVPPQASTTTPQKLADAPMRLRLSVASVLTGAAAGWCIWLLSRSVTGELEPWDSTGLYYRASLFAAGILSTLIYPRKFWLGPLGVYLGQVAYMETVYRTSLPRGDASILPSMIAVAVFGLIPAIVGALIPYVGWRFLRTRQSAS